MKKIIAMIIAAALCATMFCFLANAEEGDEWSAEVAGLNEEWNTTLNDAGEFPDDADGHTALYSVDFGDFTWNGTDKVTVNSACLRYHYILVLDKIAENTYKVAQVGNNIAWDLDGFQHDIEMGDGDLILSFFYNLNNGFTINQAHYDAYIYATGTEVYNETTAASQDLYVYIDGTSVTYSKVPFALDVIDESSEEATESSAEEISAESSAATDESTPETGDAGIIALAVISVISLAGVAVVKHK